MPIHSNAAAATVDVVAAAANRIQVTGALTFETARRARAAGLEILRASQSPDVITVDCDGVGHSDSAGLAVLLDWLANATALGRSLQFSNLPPGIQAATKISDVESMLNLQPA